MNGCGDFEMAGENGRPPDWSLESVHSHVQIFNLTDPSFTDRRYRDHDSDTDTSSTFHLHYLALEILRFSHANEREHKH